MHNHPPSPPNHPPSPPDRRRRLGTLGEELALQHYRRLGFALLERNFRTRFGELDLVVYDGTTLVFAEVKTARAGATVSAFDRLHAAKQQQVRRIARAWLHTCETRPRASRLRFDAVAVTLDTRDRLVALEQIESAF